MEGIYTLFLVAMTGAALFGVIGGLIFPGRALPIALVAALIVFAAIVAEDFRLNFAIGDATPYIVYAVIALFAAVPALLGAGLATKLRRRRG